MRILSVRVPCCLSTLHGPPAVASRCQCPPEHGRVPRLQKCSPVGETRFCLALLFKKATKKKNSKPNISSAVQTKVAFTLVRAPGWKVQRMLLLYWTRTSPRSVILWTVPIRQMYCKHREAVWAGFLLLCGRDPTLPLAAVALIVGRPVSFHSVAHWRPSEPELT